MAVGPGHPGAYREGMRQSVRPAAVAGVFYPLDPARLRWTVEDMLASSPPATPDLDPAMLIVPHAAHLYSGPVAATAYRLLRCMRPPPRRLGIIGPSHFAGFDGLAIPEAEAVATPLGEIPIDTAASRLVERGLAARSDVAHAREHCLEVQFPFVQVVVEGLTVIPVLTGDDDPRPAADAIEAMLAEGLFVVVSSDLSHYLDDAEARRTDGATAAAITGLRAGDLRPGSACGRTAVRAALDVALGRAWSCELLDLRNSGDTAGPRHRVVGYGAFVLGPEG